MKWSFSLAVIGLITAVVGCGRDNGKPLSINGGNKNAVAVDKTKYLLTEEPKGAIGVMQVKEKAKNDDVVTVIGRIGGRKNPFVAGQAAFEIVDTVAKPCNEIEGDDCPWPWDYCCEPDLPKKRVFVKFANEQGEALAFDAEKGLGLQPLQTVVIQGRAVRAADGILTSIVAQGIFVRP